MTTGSARLSLLACLALLPQLACTAAPISPRESGDDGAGDDTPGGDIGPDGGESAPPGTATFVLAHGLGGDADSFDPAIAEALRAESFRVYQTEVPPVDAVAVRAASLGPQIDAILEDPGTERVHIIAHSMGGLDSRYLISQLGYGDRVESLTTISTPHRGSPLADVAMGLTGSEDDQSAALDLFLQLAGGGDFDPDALNAALHDLSEANAAAFAAANPEDPDVLYQSYAGLSTVGGIDNRNAGPACATDPATAIPSPDALRGIFILAAPILAGGTAREPHDGVVPTASARYGDFRGCIPADHFDETGAPEAGGSSMDVAAFYRDIARELAPL